VHAPYYVNLCNPEKVSDSQKRILDSCERAHFLGASPVVFHPGYYGKLEKKDALDMVKKSCVEMSSVIGREKWATSLGLETTGKVSQFGTVDEILDICADVKRCVPVVDWSHLYAKYQGKPDFSALLKSVNDAGFRKIHTHFSNIEFTEKGEKRHLTLEHKQPDFRKVARIILDSDLEEITIISESPVLEQDSMVMKRELQELGHVF
jgi:deoxyribonuclease-4